MEEERRKFARLPKNFRVELRELDFRAGREKISTRCVNVSAGGLLLEVSRAFDLEQKVQVKLFVPNLNKFHPSYFKVFESSTDQDLLAVAKVVRVKEKLPLQLYELGIEFLDIYEDDWQALYKMLSTAVQQD